LTDNLEAGGALKRSFLSKGQSEVRSRAAQLMLKKFVEPKSIKVMKYQKKVKQKKTVEELQAELT